MKKTSSVKIPLGIITLYPAPVKNVLYTDLRSDQREEVLLPKPPGRIIAEITSDMFMSGLMCE